MSVFGVDWTGSKGRKSARKDIEQGVNKAIGEVQPGYAKARDYLTESRDDVTSRIGTGYSSAKDTARGGFTSAMDRLKTGYKEAGTTGKAGYTQARGDVQTGFKNAQGYYDTPEMVSSRAELYNRILGKGGYSPETTEAMKAGAREEFGSGLRGVEQSLGSYYGESGASGLAGENLARAGADLAGKRATAVRDIDIGNEMLKRDEQTQAMQSMKEEAYQRAGLSAEEAKMLAGLSAEEGQFLANLQQQEGVGVADLMKQQGLTEAELTTEEAQFLAQIDSEYGNNMANLTTEEATILANIFTGKGAAMAGTRDTQGMMPLFSGAVQGVAQGAAMAAVASSKEFKQDITPLTDNDHKDNLQMITDMDMVTYRYKPEFRPTNDNGKVHTGLIAEDAPESIATTDKQKLHVGDMIGVALSAIKALSERVSVLEEGN